MYASPLSEFHIHDHIPPSSIVLTQNIPATPKRVKTQKFPLNRKSRIEREISCLIEETVDILNQVAQKMKTTILPFAA